MREVLPQHLHAAVGRAVVHHHYLVGLPGVRDGGEHRGQVALEKLASLVVQDLDGGEARIRHARGLVAPPGPKPGRRTGGDGRGADSDAHRHGCRSHGGGKDRVASPLEEPGEIGEDRATALDDLLQLGLDQRGFGASRLGLGGGPHGPLGAFPPLPLDAAEIRLRPTELRFQIAVRSAAPFPVGAQLAEALARRRDLRLQELEVLLALAEHVPLRFGKKHHRVEARCLWPAYRDRVVAGPVGLGRGLRTRPRRPRRLEALAPGLADHHRRRVVLDEEAYLCKRRREELLELGHLEFMYVKLIVLVALVGVIEPVRRRNDEDPLRRQDPPHFSQQPGLVVDVLQNLERDYQIERAFAEGKLLRARSYVMHVAARMMLACIAHRIDREVEGDD